MKKPKWNKVTKLAVAAEVAPVVRAQAETALTRRVARVDEDGNVLGYVTVTDLQKSLLRRHEIEIEVIQGVRPKAVLCKQCGKPVQVEVRRGRLPETCAACRNPPCVTCGVPVVKQYGKSARCVDCYKKERLAKAKPKTLCIDCQKPVAGVRPSSHDKPVRCRDCYRASVRKVA